MAGKHHIGQLGRFGHENVLNHQKIEMLKAFFGMVEIRVGDQRIFADDVQRFELRRHGPWAPSRSPSGPIWSGQAVHAPGFFHFLAHGRVGHRLVAGEDIGQAAHVAGALHVVLAPQGVDPAARDAQVAAEHGQVGQGLDIVGAGGVLGDAHAVEDAGRSGAWRTSGPPRSDLLGRDAGDLFHIFGGVFVDHFFQLLEAFGALFDELLVVQVFADDHMHQCR